MAAPARACSGVETRKAGQAGVGAAETQRFFWELAEAGVEGAGSEGPQPPRPLVRDAREVKAVVTEVLGRGP